MGDYAMLADERDMGRHFNDLDDPDYDDYDNDGSFGDYPTIIKIHKSVFPIEKNFDYIRLPESLLILNDEWLMRKGTSCKLNEVVVIRKITDKAVLFEFVDEWENVYHWQMKGKQFWLPKSVLYKHKKEIKCIYVPAWTTFKMINKSEIETYEK